MKNILLISSLYPTNDRLYTVTPVCHYFVKEWIRAGYNVKVINLTSRYPWIVNVIAKPFIPFIKAKTGFSIYTNSPKKSNVYKYDGVEVLNIPIKKSYPHQHPSSLSCYDIAKEIHEYLEKSSFSPNIITGHVINPSLAVIYCLRQYYNSTTCLVSHGYINGLNKIPFKPEVLFNNIDIIGFRSTPDRDRFIKEYGQEQRSFVCHSGIPDTYITNAPRSFNKGISRLCFLGSLFKLKKVDVTLHAIHELGNKDIHFAIIGGGAEYKHLEQLSNQLEISGQVEFYGKQPRDKAQEIMKGADCYVMISREAFGLVYLEAMAKGLITIGLKNSGIDGVIIDGYNGFLCKDQSVESLVFLLKRITHLSSAQLQEISANAINTASDMTDHKMALKYIKYIEGEIE